MLALAAPALACPWAEATSTTCDHRPDDRPLAVPEPDQPREPPPVAAAAETPPEVAFEQVEDDKGELRLRYGMQFLPDAPAHHLFGRLVSERDAYLGAEVRYMPLSDLFWTGRVGAGLDVFGAGKWDLNLGLWIGGAGEWNRDDEGLRLQHAPIAGTEVGIGVEGTRLFTRFRWLAGIGGGPIDDLLTENELLVGYKIVDFLHVFGQLLVLNPGDAERRQGVGLGARMVL